MFSIKKFLFGDGLNENLPPDVKSAVSDWLELDVPGLESSHFLTRYVVIDIATDGMNPDSDNLTGVAATVVHQGIVSPEQSIYVDLTNGDEEAQARQLAAFLKFIGKSPLVSYHVAFVNAFA